VLRSFTVLDDPAVSAAGAIVTLQVTHPDLAQLSATLTGPTGSAGQASVSWPAGTVGRGSAAAATLTLRSPTAAGKAIFGAWQLAVSSSGVAGTLHSASLLVEGAGRNPIGQGRGSSVFEWAVRRDPGLAGAAAPADDAAARVAITRVKPAHTIGYLVFPSTAQDGAAIPDTAQAIPDACYPG
jgi:hypothetical protein